MKILGFTIPDMIMKLCKPAQVYLILSLIGVVLYVISMLDVHDKILQAEPEGEGIHRYTMGGLLLNILFTIVWVFLLNYICQFKYGKKIAWFIVLLPFFFMVVFIKAVFKNIFLIICTLQYSELEQMPQLLSRLFCLICSSYLLFCVYLLYM